MSLGAEVDAEIDLGPLVLEMMGGIHSSLGSLNKNLKRIGDIEEAYQMGATTQPVRNAKVSPSTGNFIMGLGGPAINRMWEVRRLIIGGAQWSSTVAGTAIVCIGPSGGQLTPALTDIVDEAATLPSPAFYSTRQVVVRHPNHLFVVVLSPTASTQYAVGGEVTDYPDRRFKLETDG